MTRIYCYLCYYYLKIHLSLRNLKVSNNCAKFDNSRHFIFCNFIVMCDTGLVTNQWNFVNVQVKLDKSHNGKLSRVIHIRNIPNEVSEGEIIHLGVPFGRVTNVLVLKGKSQVSDNETYLYILFYAVVYNSYDYISCKICLQL